MRSIPGPAHPANAVPSLADEVSRVVANAGTTRRTTQWSRTEVGTGVRAAAVILGVYLSFFVLRMQELYPVLAVPRLPMYLSMVILLIVLGSTPYIGWQTLFRDVPAARWQALLVALSIITAPVGIWMSGSIDGVIFRYSLSVIVFLATVLFLRDRKAMASALAVFLLSASVVGAYAISDSATTFGKSGRVRLGITLDPNDLALLMVALIPLALYMAQRRGGRNLPWLVGAALMTMAVVPTESRGGILGLGAVALTLISFGTTRWKRILYFVLVASAATAIASMAGPDSRMTDFTDYEGGEGRVAIWKRGLVWMTWRPWGYGMENFPVFFGWMNGPDRSAHNSFIEIGVELGVLGLLAFCAMWYTLARTLLKQRRVAVALRGKVAGAENEAVLATMVLAAMAGTAVTCFFLSKAYAPITLFILGLAAATVLGYPFRGAEPIPTGSPASGASTDTRRVLRRR